MRNISVNKAAAEFAPGQEAMLRKAFADRLIETVKEAQAPESFFLRGDVGDVIGMALEVKPVAWLSSDLANPALITRELQDQGIDGFALRNGTIVNRTLLEKRLAEQFELVVELGWDERLTIEGNLSLLTATSTESERRGELTSFVLGYPESAIRSAMLKRRLKYDGAPSAYEFFSYTSSKTLLDDMKRRPWTHADRQILKELEKQNLVRIERVQDAAYEMQLVLGSELQAQMVQSHRDALAHLYQTYFHVSEPDIDFLLSERMVHLTTLEGFSVYSFKVYGKDGDRQPDVQALKRIVYKALKRSGFNPTFAGFSTQSI